MAWQAVPPLRHANDDEHGCDRMSRGNVLDPTALRADDIPLPGPDAGPLAGKTVGFRLDEIWRAWDWIADIWADEFRKAGATVTFWRSNQGRTGAEGERLARELEQFLASIDIAVVGLANCGSCTGWTIRDALAAADRGLPATAVCTARSRTARTASASAEAICSSAAFSRRSIERSSSACALTAPASASRRALATISSAWFFTSRWRRS